MAITAGGALGEICRTHGIPHLIVPRDIYHPRRNLGYLSHPWSYPWPAWVWCRTSAPTSAKP